MKTNFKALITMLLFFACLASYSQLKLGVRGGLNFNNFATNYEDSDLESETKTRLGYHFGVFSDFKLTDKIGFQPSLLYTSKGMSFDDLEGNDYDRFILNYLEVPLNVKYGITDKFFALAGPYVAFGIGGKNKYEYDGEKGENTIKFGSGSVSYSELGDDEQPARRLDYGLNLGLGYQLGPVALHVNYGLGLANINPDVSGIPGFGDLDSKDFKDFHRVLSVGVSYVLK